MLKDDRIRKVIGADFFTTSLREAVETCVRAAHQDADQAKEAEAEPHPSAVRNSSLELAIGGMARS